MLTREIDWGLPFRDAEVAVDLEVLADSLNDPEIDVVDGGAALDEVLGSLLISDAYLNQLVAAKVISDPTLSTLRLATDPIPKDLAIVCVALSLNRFPIHEAAA